MKKRILALLMTLVLCLQMALPAFAEDAGMAVGEKLDAIETSLYGTAQTGSMVARIESLEDDVYGTPTKAALLDRIENLYEYIEGTAAQNGAASTFIVKLNAVDSRLNEKLTAGPAKTRIENLEEIVFGKVEKGSLNARLDKLVKMVYKTDIVPTSNVTLPKDTLVKIEFTKELSSRVAKAGDPISFVIAESVYVNDVLVLPKGATGVGSIKKVVQPRSFGRDARIDLSFSHVYAMDGSLVPVHIGDLAKQEAKTAAGAAGASIGGMIILGPIGAVGGAFVTGKSIVIPAGSTSYVQVTNDKAINGVIYQASGTAK